MQELTSRQQKILNIIIEEYIDILKPVGSIIVSKKIQEVSPATIRSEMLELEKCGYIKTESSLGRIPSDETILCYLQDKLEVFRNKTCEEIQEYSKKYNLPFFKLNKVEKEKIICIFLHLIDEKKVLLTVILSSGVIYNQIIELKEKLSQLDILKSNEFLKKTFQNKELLKMENIAEYCDKYKNHKDFFVIEMFIQNNIFSAIKQKLLIECNNFKYSEQCYTDSAFEIKVVDKQLLLLFSNFSTIYGIKLEFKTEEYL